jgi:hypothetical protein
MIAEYAATTQSVVKELPIVIFPANNGKTSPEYAIQFYSREIADWQLWDCAHTRSEAENLLKSYNRRYSAEGREWRLAKIMYVSSRA